MKKGVRLADIARELNVSTVTVSNALAGQKGVSDELRERIRNTAARMGYQSRSGIAAASGSIINIGVMISEKYLGNYPSFYWKIYQALSVAARSRNCVLMFEILTHEAEKALSLPLFTHNSKTEGIMIIGEISSRYLAFMKEETGLPQVYVDFMKKGIPVDSVMTNNYYGMYQMVNYLIDSGHRDIAYVGTIQASNSIMDRYFGYRKALMEAGLETGQDRVLEDRDMDGYMLDLKLPERMPTAFACNSDLTASIVIRALEEKGYQIPEDISVVGFDNYLYDGLCDIKITSYEVNIDEMVRTSLSMIISRIRQKGEEGEASMAIISGKLVVKDSVKVLASEEME